MRKWIGSCFPLIAKGVSNCVDWLHSSFHDFMPLDNQLGFFFHVFNGFEPLLLKLGD